MADTKDNPEKDSKSGYDSVDIDALRPGMLVDRPLYVLLTSNARYIQMVKPLHPLEGPTLAKMQKFGNVYSTEPAIDVRFPKLIEASHVVREVCNDTQVAPFEKNRALRNQTEWLALHVLHRGGDTAVSLFFFHRTFGVPKPETLHYVADLSVDMYERCLKLAALSGLIALWLGYSDSNFLCRYVEAIFCEEISAYRDADTENAVSSHSASDRHCSYEMIDAGIVPGVTNFDYLLKSLSTGDELHDVIEVARWIMCLESVYSDDVSSSRVARKLTNLFGIDFSSADQTEVAA